MKKLKFPLIIVGIMWIVYFILGSKSIQYGIHPRDITSLRGIFFAPFIHANFSHLLSNTLPLFLLTWVLALFYERFWFLAWIMMTISADTLLWIFGRSSQMGASTYHVGASITIFALIGFFLASGIFRRQFKAILVAVVVGFVYGGALYGILPSDPHVSWEGHLFGLISGIFWAFVFRKTVETNEKKDLLKAQKNLLEDNFDDLK